MSAGSSSSSEGVALFDRYAHRLRRTPTPTHAHSASLHSPVRARSQQSSPHRSPQHTRASSQTLGLPPLSAPFSPSSSVSASVAVSQSSPSSSHSSPSSMKHTRTLMRAEKPRPRATGIRWYELTSRFDVSKLDPKTAEEDIQWRQKLIRNRATDDLKALESTLLLLLDRPSHPLHAFCQHFIRAFNSHYAPLLSLSSRQSSDLLYYAVTEVDHFCTCMANLIMSLYPELYSREGVEMAKLTVFESVCPAVYSVLFSIYKRKNYYKDAEMAAKISSLQGVAIGELGVSEALTLDGTMPSAATTTTPTAATGGAAAAAAGGGGGNGESGAGVAESGRAGITAAESASPTTHRSGGSSSAATPSSSSSSRLSPSSSTPSSRLLATLAPPVINTSPAHSLPPPLHPHHTPSSAPSSPLPAADAAPSTPTSGQPSTPLSSSPSAHSQPTNGRVKGKRTAVTRLKTMTSFDREALTQGERAHAIAESLSSLNQTTENAEGAVQAAEEEQDDDQPEGEMQAGEGALSPSATPDAVSPTTQPAAAEDAPAAAAGEEAPARVSSLSAALKQLKIEGVTAEREEPPLPYNPHTLVSPLTSSSSSPVLTPSSSSPSVSTALPSPTVISPSTSASGASTAPHYPYHEAVLLFRRLSSARTPRAKLSVFQLLSSQICLCVDDYYKRGVQEPRPAASQLSINADDLLSILSFILIKSRLPSLVSEVAFIEDFVSESLRISQLGYFLAVFQASIELISNLRGRQEEQSRATAAAAAAKAVPVLVTVSKEEEEAAAAVTETETNGKMASSSLPPASPPAVLSAVISASLPHQHSSPSSLLTHSISLSSLTSSSSASSATSAATGEAGAGGEEESSAVLHADMSSLLADASQFNSYHFAVPTPEEDGGGSNGVLVGEGRGSSGGAAPGAAAALSSAADARGGGGGPGAAGGGEAKDTSSSPSVFDDKKKKKTGWLRRK